MVMVQFLIQLKDIINKQRRDKYDRDKQNI